MQAFPNLIFSKVCPSLALPEIDDLLLFCKSFFKLMNSVHILNYKKGRKDTATGQTAA